MKHESNLCVVWAVSHVVGRVLLLLYFEENSKVSCQQVPALEKCS